MYWKNNVFQLEVERKNTKIFQVAKVPKNKIFQIIEPISF